MKREAGPNPSLQQPRLPREIYARGYRFDRGFYGGEHLGGFDRNFYGLREELGRYGFGKEILRPEIIEKVERFDRPYGRYGYDRDYLLVCSSLL